MQKFHCKNNLGSIESCPIQLKLIILPDMVEEFPTLHEVQDKIEFLFGLKSIMKLDDKWTIQRL